MASINQALLLAIKVVGSSGIDRLIGRFGVLENQVLKSGNAIGVATGAAGIAAIGFGALGDEAQATANKLKAMNINFEQAVQISRESRSPLSETASLLSRMSIATQDVGSNFDSAYDATLTFQKALKLGGSTARESAAAMIQFAQAVGSGRLAGEELNSILEASPKFAKDLSKALGYDTVSAFRKASREGKVTSDKIILGLQAIKDKTAEAFKDFTPLIGDSFRRIQDNVGVSIRNSELYKDFRELVAYVAEASDGISKLTLLIDRIPALALTGGFLLLTNAIKNAREQYRELNTEIRQKVTAITDPKIAKADALNNKISSQATRVLAKSKIDYSEDPKNKALFEKELSDRANKFEKIVSKNNTSLIKLGHTMDTASFSSNILTQNYAKLADKSIRLSDRANLLNSAFRDATKYQAGFANIASLSAASVKKQADSFDYGARAIKNFVKEIALTGAYVLAFYALSEAILFVNERLNGLSDRIRDANAQIQKSISVMEANKEILASLADQVNKNTNFTKTYQKTLLDGLSNTSNIVNGLLNIAAGYDLQTTAAQRATLAILDKQDAENRDAQKKIVNDGKSVFSTKDERLTAKALEEAKSLVAQFGDNPDVLKTEIGILKNKLRTEAGYQFNRPANSEFIPTKRTGKGVKGGPLGITKSNLSNKDINASIQEAIAVAIEERTNQETRNQVNKIGDIPNIINPIPENDKKGKQLKDYESILDRLIRAQEDYNEDIADNSVYIQRTNEDIKSTIDLNNKNFEALRTGIPVKQHEVELAKNLKDIERERFDVVQQLLRNGSDRLDVLHQEYNELNDILESDKKLLYSKEAILKMEEDRAGILKLIQETEQTNTKAVSEANSLYRQQKQLAEGVRDAAEKEYKYRKSILSVVNQAPEGSSFGDAFKFHLNDIKTQVFTTDLFKTSVEGLADAFIDLAATGKQSFGELAREIAISVAKSIAKLALLKFFTAAFGGLFGGAKGGAGGGSANISPISLGGPLDSSAKALPTVGFASGGPIKAGSSYLVGETGPERFVASQSGYLLSSQQSKSRDNGSRYGSPTFNITITSPNAKSFQEMFAEDPEFLAREVNRGQARLQRRAFA